MRTMRSTSRSTINAQGRISLCGRKRRARSGRWSLMRRGAGVSHCIFTIAVEFLKANARTGMNEGCYRGLIAAAKEIFDAPSAEETSLVPARVSA